MTEKELIDTYESAYEEEFERYLSLANQFIEKARDKDYAKNLGLALVTLLTTFQASKVNNDIIARFDHIYKLGGSMLDVINAIPEILESNKILSEKWRTENKHQVSIEYKKIFGIPYGIKRINLRPALRVGSVFEYLTTDKDIAVELAKLKASFDVKNYVQIELTKKGFLRGNTHKTIDFSSDLLQILKAALEDNDLDEFFKGLQSLFASLPYALKVTEGYFHSHIDLVMRIIGVTIRSEEETNIGRIDSIIETGKYLYILEFKLSDSVAALEQIMLKKYYQRYYTSTKEVILVGVALNAKERNIADWKILPLKNVFK